MGSRPTTGGSRRARGDRGAGLISMTAGVAMFLVLITFATQVFFNLYTTSVLTGLALDAARDVAERNGTSPAEAETDFLAQVEGDVEFDVRVVGDTVRARIRWRTKSLFPAFGDARAFGVLERTFSVRVEEQQ